MLMVVSTDYSKAQSQWEWMRDTALFTRQVSGNMRLMMNNNGLFGAAAFPLDSNMKNADENILDPPGYRPSVGLEYPLGSKNEHLLAGGMWIGAIMQTAQGRKKVASTAAANNGSGYMTETKGHRMQSDTIFRASTNDLNTATRRFFDDDGDGSIDEDEIDGIDNDGDWIREGDDVNHNRLPDHGEPHVDEDAGAVSESDIYVVYRDSFPRPRIGNIPMGVTIWQKSYAWKTAIKEPILPIEFVITNSGQNILDSVYLGFYVRIMLGQYVTIRYANQPTQTRTYSLGFLPSALTAYATATARNIPPTTPIGITLLGASQPLNTMRITYRFLTGVSTYDDSAKYNIMSSGVIQHDVATGAVTYNPEQLIAVGPFLNFRPGNTIKFAIALVGGDRLDAGYNNLQDNAQKALGLYNASFRPPNFPPSPPLRFTPTKNGVTLNWKWQPGDSSANPEETWDENNKYLDSLPPTHWRKINPPPGKTGGGRNFEGYNVWRSDYPIYKENTFNLLERLDVADDLNFGNQTGIQYTYTDSPLVRGKKYWYAVTSYSIPDYFFSLTTLDNGTTRYDTINTQPYESPIFENAKIFQPSFTPSNKLGEVKVVPNPYRTDRDYTFENGGWEGLGRTWFEDKRQIWFTHLPPRATIRIFTMVGEIVATLEHDDAERIGKGLPAGQEEWPLLSASYRAIASGIYVFLVESNLGTQTGKFVVIR